MANSLMTYLDKRFKEEDSQKQGKTTSNGPVITISRQVGCNGIKLANKLATKLNESPLKIPWRVLSKEIFYESAKELDVAPEKVRRIFKTTDKYIFEQILSAFGDKKYKSEEKIAKTVREVVHGLAIDGFNIIVGRASHIIAQDVPKSLHIRQTAPLDYRINNIIENNKISRTQALDFINKVEIERRAFRKALHENTLQEELFDLTINRASFSDEQIIELLMYALEQKQIAYQHHDKMEFF